MYRIEAVETTSLAELRRMIKKGNMEAKMTVRCGKRDEKLPERLQGWRKIVDLTPGNILRFLNSTGETSDLHIKRSSLFYFDGKILRTYYPGYREPNAEEEKTLKEWEQRKSKYSPYSILYWIKKDFYKQRNMEYLLGIEEKRGLKLDWNRLNAKDPFFIRDARIRGELEMEYEIRFL